MSISLKPYQPRLPADRRVMIAVANPKFMRISRRGTECDLKLKSYIHMKVALKIVTLLFATASFFSCSTRPSNGEKTEVMASDGSPTKAPNIIYILTDDMGFGDLGCYGQSTLATPNIDQLANQGMKFTNHYTGSTVCAPSRASLLTGLHTGHVSVRGNQPDQLLTEELTVANVLKDAGYRTGLIGKWGVGHPPAPDDPLRNGFEHAYGYINMWHAHNFYPEFLYRNGKREVVEGNKLTRNEDGTRKWAEDKPEGTGVAEVRQTHAHALFEADALKFIEDNQEGPFFLYLALNMPHANNEHPSNGMEVPDYGDFADKDWPDPEKGFAQMMYLIDQTVGKVNAKLSKLGINDQTVVIFSSDNGPHQEGFHQMEFFDSNAHLRGMKRDFYDGGVKTPLIVKWPGRISEGTSTDHVSAFWDFLPTACDIAGLPIPDGLDGKSFLPTLLGNEVQEKHDYLYWEFYELGGRQAVLKDGFKAVKLNVRTDHPGAIQLYDLANDSSEVNDVADQFPEKVAEITQIMDDAHTPLSFMSLFTMDVSADTPF